MRGGGAKAARFFAGHDEYPGPTWRTMILVRVLVGDPHYAAQTLQQHRLPPERYGQQGRHTSIVAGSGFHLGNTVDAFHSAVPIGSHCTAEVKSASRSCSGMKRKEQVQEEWRGRL